MQMRLSKSQTKIEWGVTNLGFLRELAVILSEDGSFVVLPANKLGKGLENRAFQMSACLRNTSAAC